MGYILAYTLNYNNHDGRYSHSNKEWADTTCKGERGSNIRTDWIVRSHPAVLNGFVDMYRKELAVEQQREPEKPFVQQFYVVTDLQTNPMKIEKFGNLDDAMFCYQQVPNFHLKALGVEKTPDPLPGSLDIMQCKNGIDTIVEDYKKVPGWDNPYIQNHVVALVAEALKVQDVEMAYENNDGYFHIQTSEDGYDYTLYNKDFTVMDGGIVETDEYRPVQEVMEEVLAEHGHSVSECGVISAEYDQKPDLLPSIVVQSDGKFITSTASGFDNATVRKVRELLHHEKFLENGTAERARESGTEQNYNMIDGCVNNVPKKPRVIGGRVSVLDRLHIKQAERARKDNAQVQQQERTRKN